MAVAAAITSALSLHASLLVMADISPGEDVTDTMASASIFALEQALALPAASLAEVRMKLGAIIAEAGCDLVDVESLAFITRDIDALIAGSVQ